MRCEPFIGCTFGRLTVIEPAGKNAHRQVLAKCRCECGNEVVVTLSNLRRGYTKSCGCLRAEILSKNGAKVFSKRKLHQLVEKTDLSQLTTKPRQNNTSGVRGVCWDIQAQCWRAQMLFKGRKVLNSIFQNKQDAIDARKSAEEKYFKPMINKYKEASK